MFQTEVAKAKGEILKLGLLHGTLYDEEASVDEQPEWLTYAHKLFQDFMGGYYACKKFQRDCSKVKYFNHFENSIKCYSDVADPVFPGRG